MAEDSGKTMRFDVIQALINKFNYKKYLEIGIQYKQTWNKITCESKTGVEPIHDHKDPNIKHVTSDEFFKTNTNKFDIVFIDGDHVYEQVTKDINNCLKFLEDGGAIVCHDTNPVDEAHTNPYLNGTVFRAICDLRNKNGYNVWTYDGDHGVTIIKKGNMAPWPHKVETYAEFDKNRKDILNLLPWDELLTKL